MAIGRLATRTARLPEFCTTILTTSKMDMVQTKFRDLVFGSPAELLAEPESTSCKARGQIRS